MKPAMIAAVSRNMLIGNNNRLPWHLPADLKYFKNRTTGHHIILGRKNYEAIGKALPNRTNIIVTRQFDYKAENCIVVHSINEALALCGNDHEPFICGGSQIYKLGMSFANRLYITWIDADFDGDIFFPEIDTSIWKMIDRQDNEPNDRNLYRYSFTIYERYDNNQ